MGWAALVALAPAGASVLLVGACAEGGSFDYVLDGSALEGGSDEGGAVLPLLDSGVEGGARDSGGAEDAGSLPCTGAIVINEIKVAGATANDEFVELFNPTGCDVALGGWSIRYQSASGGAGSAGHLFAGGASIPSRGFYLVASATFSGRDADLQTGFAASGQIGLVDDTSRLVDAVAYGTVTGGTYREGSAAPSPSSSGSLARKADGVDTDNNAADFAFATPGSPGSPN